MAWHLSDTEALSKPMLACLLDPWKKLYVKFKKINLKMLSAKCQPFAWAAMCSPQFGVPQGQWFSPCLNLILPLAPPLHKSGGFQARKELIGGHEKCRPCQGWLSGTRDRNSWRARIERVGFCDGNDLEGADEDKVIWHMQCKESGGWKI